MIQSTNWLKKVYSLVQGALRPIIELLVRSDTDGILHARVCIKMAYLGWLTLDGWHLFLAPGR
jgi:hypothetical protein